VAQFLFAVDCFWCLWGSRKYIVCARTLQPSPCPWTIEGSSYGSCVSLLPSSCCPSLKMNWPGRKQHPRTWPTVYRHRFATYKIASTTHLFLLLTKTVVTAVQPPFLFFTLSPGNLRAHAVISAFLLTYSRIAPIAPIKASEEPWIQRCFDVCGEMRPYALKDEGVRGVRVA